MHNVCNTKRIEKYSNLKNSNNQKKRWRKVKSGKCRLSHLFVVACAKSMPFFPFAFTCNESSLSTNLANATSAAAFFRARIRQEQTLLLRSSLISAIFESELSVSHRLLLGGFVSFQHVHDLILQGCLCCGRSASKFPSALCESRLQSNTINYFV